jgi:archaellum component FlaF (FlaF/FlaG flagellin family)
MRPRLFIACVASACLLVPAASAHPAAGTGKVSTTLKVRSCAAGDTAKQRSATFYARMQAIKGTNTMSMRFTLIDRAGDGPATIIDSPALSQWRKSRPGVARFGYAQSVAGLNVGGVYAMQVQFRWLDSRNHVIRSVKRASDSCRQEGQLPNLAITRVAARQGDSTGTEHYSVDVTNSGQGEARLVDVDLFVDGAGADTYRLELVKPGETVTVRFTGPVCKSKVRAITDKSDTINELNEDDNILRSSCPAMDA